MLVRFNDVTRSFGAFDVLDHVSFQIHAGDKLGLIGANGSGKTTLLHLTDAPEEADGGTVDRASGLRLGRVDQHPVFGAHTVLEEALTAFGHLQSAERDLRELESRIASDHDPALLDRYAGLQHDFEHKGGYSHRARTEAALLGLGFRREQFGQPAGSLSGGEQSRLVLARLLLGEVDLLLLDEPTNHLDIRSIEWLEHFLTRTDKSLLVVSHDRFFLDRVALGILELESGRIRQYRGNYSSYLEQREQRRESQEREWKKQQEWIERTEDYIRRNIAGQKTRQAQSRRKALARIDRVERPPDAAPAVRFRFSDSVRSGRYVVGAQDLAVGYEGRDPVVAGVTLQVERGQRWAILGPNGSGKTTLLATLSGRRKPLSGELVRHETVLGYYDQQLGGLHAAGTVLEEIRTLDGNATDGELRNFLAGFLFRGDAVHKRAGDLSGGERSRLALARLIYRTPPLLSLDEPTNHLDVSSREALEAALGEYPGTLLFVTHDRRFVERIATHILYLRNGRAEIFDTFDRFGQWLSEDVDTQTPPTKRPVQESRDGRKPGKNRKAQAGREAERLEARIEEAERELHEMEALFQNPPPGSEWEATSRRYLELKGEVEVLYAALAEQLENM